MDRIRRGFEELFEEDSEKERERETGEEKVSKGNPFAKSAAKNNGCQDFALATNGGRQFKVIENN